MLYGTPGSLPPTPCRPLSIPIPSSPERPLPWWPARARRCPSAVGHGSMLSSSRSAACA